MSYTKDQLLSELNEIRQSLIADESNESIQNLLNYFINQLRSDIKDSKKNPRQVFQKRFVLDKIQKQILFHDGNLKQFAKDYLDSLGFYWSDKPVTMLVESRRLTPFAALDISLLPYSTETDRTSPDILFGEIFTEFLYVKPKDWQ